MLFMSNFFSIAIPTYEMHGKGVEFLEFNLSKIRLQTFKDYEVVVSDHSKNADIKNVCIKWAEQMNIKYIRNDYKIGSSSANINTAMKHCTGKWIKIIFQDDFLYDSTALQKIHNNINNETIWLATACCHTNDGINLHTPHTPRWSSDLHLGNNLISSPSVITIKNMENKIFFDEELIWLMDVDFYKKVYDVYGEPKYIKEIGMVNRTWGNRLSDTISFELKIKETNMLKEKYEKINLENDGERMDIDYYNMNYNSFDIYQQSHYKRYEFAKSIISKNDIVVDMSCGSGYGTMMLSENAAQVNGFDIDKRTIEEISKRYKKQNNVSFNTMDLLDISDVNYYDKIISFETVEHFNSNDINKLLKKFHSALKDNGYLIFSTPYYQEDSEASRKFHKTFHIVESTLLQMLSGLFIIEQLFYQNYAHHDLVGYLPHKNFIICVAKKIN